MVSDDKLLISDLQSALDLIATTSYETGASGIILDKSLITEEFFDLKTRLAGEILQKFTTYQLKIAIIGDYSKYQSKSLKDFIFESNKGNQVFFFSDVDEALKRLGSL